MNLRVEIILLIFILFPIEGKCMAGKKEINNTALESLGIPDSGFVNGINYKFVIKGAYYSFRSSFFSKSNIECISSISFDYNHKVKYNKVVKSMNLLQQGKNWYEVCYTYEKFYFIENTSKWILVYFPDKNKIIIKMISNKSNIPLFDFIISSDGYFKFSAENNGYRIEYFQECLLSSDLVAIPYVPEAKNDALNFIKDYKEYLEKTCI